MVYKEVILISIILENTVWLFSYNFIGTNWEKIRKKITDDQSEEKNMSIITGRELITV